MQLIHDDQCATMEATIAMDDGVMMGPHAMKNEARYTGRSRELEAVAGHVREVKQSQVN